MNETEWSKAHPRNYLINGVVVTVRNYDYNDNRYDVQYEAHIVNTAHLTLDVRYDVPIMLRAALIAKFNACVRSMSEL